MHYELCIMNYAFRLVRVGGIMMRIAICEDMPGEAAALKNALERYLRFSRISAKIDHFKSGEEFLSAFSPGKYQVVFMDIYLKKGGISGMDAAARAFKADRDIAFVLITVSTSHAIAGYGFAQYYIVKPIEDRELAKAMDKCREQILRFSKTIEVVVDRNPMEIRLRDIHFVEASDHDLIINTSAGEITVSGLKINEFAEALGGSPFVHCHRSYIVNLFHMKAVQGGDFHTQSGKIIPIGRTKKADVRKSWGDHFWNSVS